MNSNKLKYLKYKKKYDELQKYYDLIKQSFKTATEHKKLNEYCYITQKKFDPDDLIMQCPECKHWGLAEKMYSQSNCIYCNDIINKTINLTTKQKENLYKLLFEIKHEENIDKQDPLSLININNNLDNKIDLYNELLLDNNIYFINRYNLFLKTNDPYIKDSLYSYLNNITSDTIPSQFNGSIEYHKLNHLKNSSTCDSANCLYCKYNKIL
tara:strand:- start:299 stop:931 length:633 start_codon:yes stop_codon:yes gene_type:complete